MSLIQDVDGYPWPSFFPVEPYYVMRDLQFRPNDIILCSYPKCGNHWIGYTIWGILYPDKPAPDAKTITEEFVFGDAFGLGRWADSPEDQGRLLSTHLPFDRLNMNNTTKFVIIVRNPMDCCVSYYHFMKTFPGANYIKVEGQEIPSLFFEEFMDGKAPFGDYFTHLKLCYDRRDDPNVHIIVYEKLKANPKEETLKLAKFLGYEKALEANDGQLLNKVVEQSSFNVMKKNVQYEAHLDEKVVINVLRKGEAGGYKKSLTSSQIQILKERTEKEFAGTELLDLWKPLLDGS